MAARGSPHSSLDSVWAHSASAFSAAMGTACLMRDARAEWPHRTRASHTAGPLRGCVTLWKEQPKLKDGRAVYVPGDDVTGGESSRVEDTAHAGSAEAEQPPGAAHGQVAGCRHDQVPAWGHREPSIDAAATHASLAARWRTAFAWPGDGPGRQRGGCCSESAKRQDRLVDQLTGRVAAFAFAVLSLVRARQLQLCMTGGSL